jgi:hypothetical protein
VTSAKCLASLTFENAKPKNGRNILNTRAGINLALCSNLLPISCSMASVAAGLFSALPKPKYTGEDEEIPLHAQPKGPRIVGPGVLGESQIVLKVSSNCTDFMCEEITDLGA